MYSVLVLGTGTMGLGIAQATAAARCCTYIASAREFPEINRDINQKAIEKITMSLDKMVKKGKISEADMKATLERLVPIEDLSSVADKVQMVIEAAAENLDIKKKIFEHMDRLFGHDVIFATNSSALCITELASATKRSDKFLGVHFFNPAPIMKLVEIVTGVDTSESTIDFAKRFIEAIGKTSILVTDSPGFVVNRILVPMINEACFTLMEGVASPEDIDNGLKLGANHPIGPLALADMIGLDVVLAVMETFYSEFGDSKYRPCPLLRKKVKAGQLGRKTGRGFYSYT